MEKEKLADELLWDIKYMLSSHIQICVCYVFLQKYIHLLFQRKIIHAL